MARTLLGLGSVLALCALPAAQSHPVRITLQPTSPRTAGPLEVRLGVDEDIDPAQLERIARSRLLSFQPGNVPVHATLDGEKGVTLRWVQPALEADKAQELSLTPVEHAHFHAFRFATRDGHRDLLFGQRPMLRWVATFDAERFEETKKPYHHVFATHDDGVITKGSGGLYSHHRGLFCGWSKTRCEGESWDFWHCQNGVHQRVVDSSQTANRVFAQSTNSIEWRTKEDRTIVRESRRVTTWATGEDHLLVDFEIDLASATGKVVELDGDPQHAGFQFRAANEVSERQKETVYVRPENAHGGGNDVWKDLRRAACRFTIRSHPYTVMHLSHPGNPKGAVYSTRAYARFGAFNRHTLEPGETLRLRYRIIVWGGEPPDADALRDAFSAWTEPPGYSVDR